MPSQRNQAQAQPGSDVGALALNGAPRFDVNDNYDISAQFASDSLPDDKRAVTVVLAPPGRSREVVEFKSAKEMMDSDRYGDILAAAHSGTLFSIDYWITAFVNRPNINFKRIEDGDVDGVVGRFSSPVPILYGHRWDGKKGGKVLRVEKSTGRGSADVIDAKLSARTSEMQVNYLKGLVETYSLGLMGGSVKCSICKEKWKSEGGYTWPSCNHRPGVKYESRMCEGLVAGAKISEVSTTDQPAIEESRNKSATYEADGPEAEQQQQDNGSNKMTFEELKAKYDALVAQVEADKAGRTEFETKAKTEFEAKVEKANKDAEAASDLAVEFALEALVAAGNILPARAKDEKFVAAFRKLGARDGYDTFREQKVGIEFSDKRLSRDSAPPSGTPPPASKPYELGSSAKVHGLTPSK